MRCENRPVAMRVSTWSGIKFIRNTYPPHDETYKNIRSKRYRLSVTFLLTRFCNKLVDHWTKWGSKSYANSMAEWDNTVHCDAEGLTLYILGKKKNFYWKRNQSCEADYVITKFCNTNDSFIYSFQKSVLRWNQTKYNTTLAFSQRLIMYEWQNASLHWENLWWGKNAPFHKQQTLEHLHKMFTLWKLGYVHFPSSKILRLDPNGNSKLVSHMKS